MFFIKRSNEKQRVEKYFYILSFLAGLLQALSFAPFNFIFASFLSFLFIINVFLNVKTFKEIFKNSLIFCTSYSLVSMHWIFFALTNFENLKYFAPFSVILLVIFFNFYFLIFAAIFFSFIRFIDKKTKHTNIVSFFIPFVFAFLWIFCFEYLRSLGQFGFPWNLTGTVILDLSFASKIIHQHGIYYTGFFLILIFAFLYQIIFSLLSKKILLAILQSSLIIFISFCIIPNDVKNYIQKASLKLIKSTDKQKCNFKDSIGLMNNYVFKKPYVGVRIVSTNISQKDKKGGVNQETHLINNIKSTFKENYDYITYFIWPETSFGFLVKMNDDNKIISNKYINYISSFLKKDQFFIIGCMRKNNEKIFNSIIVLNHKGEVVSHYDKNRLVPFGEFIPFGEFLPFEKFLKFTGLQSFNTFKKSEERKNLECSENEKFKRIFYPLICFEAIFPFKESDQDLVKNSNLILNLSSDAWFDKKFATSQHLRMARVRAIEAKKTLIRLSNGGWNALIDGDGKILYSAKPGTEGFIDVFIK